jgi:hypothetical protein
MASGGHHPGSTRVRSGLSRHSQNVGRVQTTASRATFGAWRSGTARPHNWRDAECHWNPIWHLRRSRRFLKPIILSGVARGRSRPVFRVAESDGNSRLPRFCDYGPNLSTESDWTLPTLVDKNLLLHKPDLDSGDAPSWTLPTRLALYTGLCRHPTNRPTPH